MKNMFFLTRFAWALLAVLFAGAATLPLSTTAFAGGSDGVKTDEEMNIVSDPDKPYKIADDGQVDMLTLKGYKVYHEACHVCHGPNALGSSFAPGLAESLKTLDEDAFFEVVVNGRTEETGAAKGNVMPAFGDNPNIMPHVGELYAYIKARSDGVVAPGRPKSWGEKKLFFDD